MSMITFISCFRALSCPAMCTELSAFLSLLSSDLFTVVTDTTRNFAALSPER